MYMDKYDILFFTKEIIYNIMYVCNVCIVLGMVAGAYCVLASIYSTEICEKEIRGTVGCFTQMNISMGILLASILGRYLDIQVYTGICAAIPICFGLLFILMPESPVHYLKKNKQKQARSALIRLRGKHFDVDTEIAEIQKSFEESHEINMSMVKESLLRKATQRGIVIAFGLMLFRVLCGIDAVTTFASYTFEVADVALDENTATIVLTAVQTTAGIFQPFIVDRLGRKILLLASDIVMSICMLIIGLSLLLKERNIAEGGFYDALGYVPLVAFYIFVTGYAIGLGPIPFMICGEVFPQEIKSILASAASFVSWISTFVILKVFLIMREDLGLDVTFLIFAGFAGVGAFFIFFFVIETKGKTLDEIQTALGRGKH